MDELAGKGIDKPVKAMNAEWKRLRDQVVWDESVVREWNEIGKTAREKNQKVHLAMLFGFCVLKGAELESGDPRQKYKYRVVFQGNRVVDENWESAIFQDAGAAPAMMEAARMMDMMGCQDDWTVEQADAEQAYVQSTLKGTETWVEIPYEAWPQ